MTDTPLPDGPAPRSPDVAERNVERLIEEAYRPEAPDPAFVQRVRDRLAAVAAERVPSPRRLPIIGRHVLCALAGAAAVAGLAFLSQLLTVPAPRDPDPVVQHNPSPTRQRGPQPSPAGRDAPESPADPPRAPALLTPRPRPDAPPVAKLAVGQSLRTPPGVRQRVVLPDGSVLNLNQKTEVKLDADRRVTLSAGEVFVEVAPRSSDGGEAARFTVTTPQREVIALGTRFNVSARDSGTGVLVTQGKVRVSGLEDVLIAGQELAPGARRPTAAPRAAAALAWTRELLCAAEAPLVPPSKYAGGALVVNDPSGESATLSLRKYHVDVHVEDGFARTTIDQTYFNHTQRRLEGTFHFPLPPDASLSRLAMYVNGQLMEGGMAERDFARQTFESIVRRMQDPALLEWVDGSTFQMRVFPLEPRQEKRIILSYTQRLPVQYGRTSYRFPAGHSLQAVRDWSFHARIKGGKDLTWASDTHPDRLTATTEKDDLLLDARQNNVRVDRDVAFDLFDVGQVSNLPESKAGWKPAPRARFSSMDHDGARYLLVRYRPELPAAKDRQRRDWVFLFESSGDRDPLLARTQIEIIRNLLNNAEHDDTFAVVTAATRAGTLAKVPQPATPENVAAAVRFLEGTHLAGALDLGKALAAAEPFLKAARNPYLVHVGSGHAVLGETKAEVLAKRVPTGARYVGVAVGKRWNRALMKTAAERSGGFFAQINPDEPVTWRAFELYSALTTPRLLGAKVIDTTEKVTFLTHTSAVAQGEEVCAIARLEGNAPLPEVVTVTGTLDGKTFHRTIPVRNVASGAGYLPRTWARLEIDRLLAENAQANKARLVQLSLASYVMTPFTSLLVLENEQMYAQYHVDRGRKDHWAMYACPETIPVVYEPLADMSAAPKASPAVQPSADDVLATILVRVPPQTFGDGGAGAPPRAVTVRDLYSGAFGVPVSALAGGTGKDALFLFWSDDSNGAVRPGQRSTAGENSSRPMEFTTSAPNGSVPGTVSPQPTSQPTSSPSAGPFAGGGPMPGGMGRGGFPGVPGGGFGGGAPGGGMMPPGGSSLPGGMPSGGGGMMPPGGYNLAGGIGGFNGGALGFGGGGFGLGGGPGMGPGFPPSQEGRPGPQTGGGSGQSIHYAPGFVSPTMTWSVPMGAPGNPYAFYNPYAGYFALAGGGRPSSTGRPGPSSVGEELDKSRGHLRDLATLKQQLETYQRLRTENAPALSLELLRSYDHRELDGLRDFSKLRRTWREANQKTDILDGEALVLLARRLAVLQAQQAATQAAGAGMPPPTFLAGFQPDTFLYRRPTFAPDSRLFTDLVAFAPGLNTTLADVLGILEAETAPDPADAPGAVDPAARALIEGARAAGWRTITFPAAGGAPAWSVSFDGSGRYALERMLPSGLQEHAVCDGKELLHLYPELGLASRRTVTRFHRRELADLVPWALPPVKDLAHGFDVKAVGERIVALIPWGHKAEEPVVVLHLVFAADGRLAERRLVEMPKNKVLRRETYGEDGTVKVLDAEGKPLSERRLALKAGGAADLDPDLKHLVVLPLPLRTREHLLSLPAASGGNIAAMAQTALLALLAADAATGNAASVEGMVRARFWSLADNRPGFTALLLSAGYDVNALPVPGNGSLPLARYVARVRQKGTAEPKDARLGDGLLRRLAEVQALLHRWQQPGPLAQADCARMVKYVREARSPAFVWAVVQEVLRSPDKKVVAAGGRTKVQHDVLQAATEVLKDVPGLGYAARYEYACHLAENGQRDEARKRFIALYQEAAKGGTLPAVDRRFKDGLKSDGQETDRFARLLRDTASGLVKDDRRVGVVALAWQCWELGAPALAEELLSQALGGITDSKRRLVPTLAALEYLWQTHQYDRADQHLQELLADETFARHAGLWRMGYQLALQRKQPAQAFTCLAEALEQEYRANHEWIDVEAVRRDYGALLGHYAEVVRATATLAQKPPADLAAKVVRAADRWRALDPDGTAASHWAFQSLRSLGDADLAWDYLLMSIQSDANGFSWANLAQSLVAAEDFDLAERAYAQACLADPANTALLRARADNLQRAGHPAAARDLLQGPGNTPRAAGKPPLP